MANIATVCLGETWITFKKEGDKVHIKVTDFKGNFISECYLPLVKEPQ